MRTNHILIDLENLQPASLAGLEADFFRVLVFVGAGQTKISFDLACSLQKLGNRADYVKISGQGKNALDFHIAFYIGKIAQQDPAAYFHIISQDTGFDPLVQHLKSLKIGIARVADIGDIPAFKASNAKTFQEKLALVVSNLRQRGDAGPRTVKTLSGTIRSLFQKELPGSMPFRVEAEGFIRLKPAPAARWAGA